MPTSFTLSPRLARRLFITQQRLAAPPAAPDADAMLGVVRDLGCVQLDPLAVVARSHQLVMFSRVGPYDPADFDYLLYDERSLFEYWAHCASIVLTEDYPIHSTRMRSHSPRYPHLPGSTRAWLRQNQKLKRRILSHIRRHGPTLSRDLEGTGHDAHAWVSTGWTSGRNVSKMLDNLWMAGQIMVVGRQGTQKVWDLTKRHLPDWAPREKLTEHEMTRRAALKALRALGVATSRHINFHFLRWRYRDLPGVLKELEAEGKIQQVTIKDRSGTWPGEWYVAADALPPLAGLSDGAWSPRTTLLSPFDNLICDRKRTAQFFDFDFTVEIYVPAAKRKYGYYVLPILHGDRLIGRVDPKMDRERGVLVVNAVYAEPGAPRAGVQVRAAVESLASFLGARDIDYDRSRLAPAWKRKLLA
jgi:uncharacterized protein YcaQ